MTARRPAKTPSRPNTTGLGNSSTRRRARPETEGVGRYILVIVTDEFTLNRHTVEAFLAGATFRPTMIDDVVLGLPYHPSSDEGGGSCPVFSLPLARG